MALVAVVAAWPQSAGGWPMCNTQTYTVTWFGEDPACYNVNAPDVHTCALQQSFYCATHEAISPPTCMNAWDSGCAVAPSCSSYWPLAPPDYCPLTGADTSSTCTKLGTPEVCGNGVDDDWDGCADGGCVKGTPPCSCVASCAVPACSPVPTATCDPYNGEREVCANGKDDNCNGWADEGCAPKNPDMCLSKAGADPILLGTRSAVTEPFADFAVDGVTLTRTYASGDGSLMGEVPPGIFGAGWHHEWEGSLRCAGGVCTVSRGLEGAWRFSFSQATLSPDGTEAWDVYRPWKDDVTAAWGDGVLVRRASGLWVHHLADGRELRYAAVCDPCDASGLTCVDPLSGGEARLVGVVDAAGNAIEVGYDRPAGLLLAVEDGLGHALEVRGEAGCGVALARELRYDGMTVASYEYRAEGLAAARDGDGSTLRSYVYEPGGGYLTAVLDDAGSAIAEFSYDGAGNAIGLVDASSSVSVSYGAGSVEVTELRGLGAASTSTRTLDQDGHVTSVSADCACGPAQTLKWVDRRLACATDASGKTTYQRRDAQGRVTERAEWVGGACPPKNEPEYVQAPRKELFAYGATRTVAQGVELGLSVQTSATRASRVNGSMWRSESWDYAQGASAIDPPGYVCAPASLPAGSVACRHIETGYVGPLGSTTREKHATFFSYDARGRRVRTYGPVSVEPVVAADVVPVEERVYWADDELLARRGRLAEVRRYATPTTAPLVTRFDWDAFGIYKVVAPDGGTRMTIRDGRGRPILEVGPDGERTETRYRAGLSPRLRIAPGEATTRYGYDARGRLQTTEQLDADPDAGPYRVAWSEHRSYDEAGNVVRLERRGEQGEVTWRRDREYDAQHRVVRELHPVLAGASRDFSYGGNGFLTAVTEGGRATAFTPDALGRVAKVRRQGLNAQGQPVEQVMAAYAYERQVDEVASVTDGAGWTTEYRRDDFGRLQELSSATIHFSPSAFLSDVRGNLRQRRSGPGDYYGRSYTPQVNYAYDGLDRLVYLKAANAVDGATLTYKYVYDEAGGEGYLTSVVEPERTVRLKYDRSGRVTEERMEENGVTTPLVTGFGYGADGGLETLRLPTGRVLRYVRDAATGRPVRVEDVATGEAFVAEARWVPGGPVAGLSFGNGQQLSRTYDLLGQVASLASGPVALEYSMTSTGEVAAIVEGGTTRTFQYDLMARLAGSLGALAYAYDGNGNRKSETVDGVAGTFVLSQDRVTEKLDAGGVRRLAFGYDRDMNISGVAKWSGSTPLDGVCLRHDPLGRLSHAGKAAGGCITPGTPGNFSCVNDDPITSVTARFKYDFRNRRVASWRATTNEWVYTVFGPGGEPLAELAKPATSSGAWRTVREYVWLEGLPVAQIEHDAATGAARTYAVHTDAIGLPRALTSPAGATVWSANPARPYGDITEATTPDPETGRTVVTNLRLPVQYDERLLGSLGLQGPYYNWNRWYLPGVGRYLELDPMAEDGDFNSEYAPDWYGYVDANPLKFTDSDGRSKTQGIGGDDPAQRELKEAAKRGRGCVDQVAKKWEQLRREGSISPERWRWIKGWIKVAKRGDFGLLPFFHLTPLCGPNLECIKNSPNFGYPDWI
jgi:RHS repeat-associated protein